MRALADAERIHELMRALGRGTRVQASIYFTGGATAVLYGWAMLRLGLVEPEAMLRYHERVLPDLHRYPSIDADSLREAVERLFGPGRDTEES